MWIGFPETLGQCKERFGKMGNAAVAFFVYSMQPGI